MWLIKIKILDPLLPMADTYITIQEAADLSEKSVQTIRRAIKAKKLKCKKKKTPQGFNYSISLESLQEAYDMTKPVEKAEQALQEEIVEKAEKKVEKKEDKIMVDVADFQSFAKTMERLVSQHAEERQSFLRLVNTLQEKIFVLENQVNLLKAPEKRWYQVWK